ncbi:Signal transduction response regulator / Tetratricopeptide repeat-containing protein [Acidisarcina polymorpha]|uniref:Signal transduction response regulator / Tetratricopeptide repeat-containing protein n=1 Tax=Acidisarcina polymorpha TaxID=2211140 RepID=A0A2Z5FXU1_9BACT|nr:winged helix-turn-helix domain-containing protein [Acidisarcina polymorpha]AXC11195.1 Signal transduction response regulator / Tetratricopeptide repeat-containing protein [Acidisarcina polymorpha]
MNLQPQVKWEVSADSQLRDNQPVDGTPPGINAVRVETIKEIAFTFGPFRLIPSRQLLIRGRSPVKLGARALDVLHLLLTRTGEEVSKDALIEFAWPNVFVDQANLKVHISGLRRALEDTFPNPTYIATIPGRGYQFVAPVQKELIDQEHYTSIDQQAASGFPVPSTLVGRQRDLQAIARALEFTNLVTLVGPGGVGKTSLAIAVAHIIRKKYPDGIHFVDLSVSSDPTLVPHLIATSVGIRTEMSDFVPVLRSHLRDKRALIVIDNCEHVLHAAATIVSQLIQEKARGRLLTTSREPLGVSSEHLQRIEPLGVPGPKAINSAMDAMSYPSVELFAIRALESTGYELNDQDAQAIADLCERLDGLPLAIEIAAAKLDQFSPSELLESLRGRVAQLGQGEEKSHARHRTLWATLDWSYRLLSIEEAMLFRLLSVFAGPFEWTEVAGMARILRYSPYTTTLALGGLVAKSLISADLDGEQLRYQLLFSARDFAAEHLINDPYARDAHHQHAVSVLTTLQKAETEWSWVDNRLWRTRYGEKAADLRKALDWCFGASGDPTLGISLAIAAIRLWNEQSSTIDQLYQVDRALQHCVMLPEGLKRGAQLATSRAWGLLHARRLRSEADNAWNTALEVARLDGGVDQEIAVHCGRVIFFVYTGRCDQAIIVLDQFARIAEHANDQASLFDEARLRAFVSIHLGHVVEVRIQLEQLAKELDRGLSISRAASRYGLQRLVSVQTTLALANWLSGRPRSAVGAIEELLSRTSEARQLIGQAHVLALFAMPLALWMGDIETLERYTKMLRDILNVENIALWDPVQRFYEHVARQARGHHAIEEIQSAIQDLVKDNFVFRTPMYLGVLAQILLRSGQREQAQETIESALKLQHQLQERWCLPELMRIKGSVLEALGEHAMADAWRRRALEGAQRDGSRFLELRVANDLAETALDSGDFSSAVNLLCPITKFSDEEEEFPTEDFGRRARLLAEARTLASSAAYNVPTMRPMVTTKHD